MKGVVTIMLESLKEQISNFDEFEEEIGKMLEFI